MAKMKIIGDVCVIESLHTLADLQTLQKYAPKSLSLFETNEDGKREEIFRVCTTTGKGSIGTFGASFASESHDERKVATITMALPSDVEDAVEYVAEAVGLAIVNLNKVEAQIPAALEHVAADKAAVMANIELA